MRCVILWGGFMFISRLLGRESSWLGIKTAQRVIAGGGQNLARDATRVAGVTAIYICHVFRGKKE
jgi:hypothetical protein